jgi:LPXTG-motif cell wall-anchored protein
VGQLVFGLFAAICVEMIKVPNTVIYTGETDDWLIAGGMLFVLLGAVLLFRHAFALVFLPGRKENAPLI